MFTTQCLSVPPTYTSSDSIFSSSYNLFNVSAKANSGASKHFLKPEHASVLRNLLPVPNGPPAVLPNKKKIHPTHQGYLPLSSALSESATSSLIYPGITNKLLVSIGQLCDDDCLAIFTKKYLHIFKNNKLLLKGYCNWLDGLWDIPLQMPLKNCHINQSNQEHTINFIIQKDKTKLELALYLHGCAFSPSLTTFQKCIHRGNFISWPDIEDINFERILKTTLATAKGHLHQEKQNLQSTKLNSTTDEDHFPIKIPLKTNNVFGIVITPPTP